MSVVAASKGRWYRYEVLVHLVADVNGVLIGGLVIGFWELWEFEELGDFGGREPDDGGHGWDEGERFHFPCRVGDRWSFLFGVCPIDCTVIYAKEEEKKQCSFVD